MDLAEVPVTTLVSLSAPEEWIIPQILASHCRKLFQSSAFFNGNCLPCSNLYSSPLWCCITITCSRRKLVEFKWNLSQGKSVQSSWFHLYILFLKLMSIPVRDGIIDLNQIMKHYTFYSKIHFSGIQFCNVSLTGNAGWSWGGWKILLCIMQSIVACTRCGVEVKVSVCNRIIVSLRNWGSVALGRCKTVFLEFLSNRSLPWFLEEHLSSADINIHRTNTWQAEQRCLWKGITLDIHCSTG